MLSMRRVLHGLESYETCHLFHVCAIGEHDSGVGNSQPQPSSGIDISSHRRLSHSPTASLESPEIASSNQVIHTVDPILQATLR